LVKFGPQIHSNGYFFEIDNFANFSWRLSFSTFWYKSHLQIVSLARILIKWCYLSIIQSNG
jgi:hypothetical protein